MLIMKRQTISAALLSITIAACAMAQTNALQVVPPSLLPELLALNGDLETVQKPKYLSPTAMVATSDKKYIYIAEQYMKQVAKFDCATNQVVQTMPLPNEPTGVVVSKDGATLYVTCASDRWPAGFVCVIPTASGKVTRRIAAGHHARSPVLSPDGGTLYVCNWLGNNVSVIDLAAGIETKRIAVTREPYAAAITPDGATLVVTNSLPEQKATDTIELTGKVSLIATATNTVRATVPVFPVGTHSLFGASISADGKYAFITHLVGRFTLPAVTLTGGWVHSNNMAIIDIEKAKLINDVELDNAQQGYANPWGIAQTGDGKYLCVLHAGSQVMTVIDYPQFITKALAGQDLSHDFTAIYSIKNAFALSVKGPRSIIMVDNKAYIAGYFSDSLQAVTVSSLSPSGAAFYALGASKPMNSERLGAFNYFDANNCFQRWQSCFSCHPFGRPDALNWMLASESTRQRNAKSMLYSWWTPPTAWNGRRPHAGGPDGSIRMGVYYELMITPTEDVSVPMDTFLMRMKPVMSPFLVKGRLSAEAVRGKAIYDRIGCNSCHPAPLYTDNDFHNAGVPDSLDAGLDWNTPSLNEAWRTAPYAHTGGYDKIREIIQLRAHSLGASQLTEQELDELVEYVSSL
jgi:YVTN family beta-propeller protein